MRSYTGVGFSNDTMMQDLTSIANMEHHRSDNLTFVDILSDNTKEGMDLRMLDIVQSYLHTATQISGGDKDITSIYDAINPPPTLGLPTN